MKSRAAMVNKTKARVAAGDTGEALVTYLRAEGCSKIESIAVLREALSIGLGEAKALVEIEGSEVWRDVRDRDEKLWDDAERTLRESGWTDAASKAPE